MNRNTVKLKLKFDGKVFSEFYIIYMYICITFSIKSSSLIQLKVYSILHYTTKRLVWYSTQLIANELFFKSGGEGTIQTFREKTEIETLELVHSLQLIIIHTGCSGVILGRKSNAVNRSLYTCCIQGWKPLLVMTTFVIVCKDLGKVERYTLYCLLYIYTLHSRGWLTSGVELWTKMEAEGIKEKPLQK